MALVLQAPPSPKHSMILWSVRAGWLCPSPPGVGLRGQGAVKHTAVPFVCPNLHPPALEVCTGSSMDFYSVLSG